MFFKQIIMKAYLRGPDLLVAGEGSQRKTQLIT